MSHEICHFKCYTVGAITAGRLVCYWNLPLFSYSSIDPQLSDKTVYNTLIRMMSPFNHMATCLGKLFQHYQVSTELPESLVTNQSTCIVRMLDCSLIEAKSAYSSEIITYRIQKSI